MYRIALSLTCMISLTLIGLVMIAMYIPKENIATETYKALLQLVVIGAAVHVVCLLITKANNEMRELLQLNGLKKLLPDKLNHTFTQWISQEYSTLLKVLTASITRSHPKSSPLLAERCCRLRL